MTTTRCTSLASLTSPLGEDEISWSTQGGFGQMVKNNPLKKKRLMKKFLQNVLARALCVTVLGVLLIVFSEAITTWIVMVSGVVFIIPGVVAIVSYFRQDPQVRQIMLYPVLGAGCVLFGFVQLLWPMLFLSAIVYILSVLLFVVAATQFYTLWSIHRSGCPIHPAYYLLPALELVATLYVILYRKAEEVAGLPIILIGCGFVVYALLELWTIYMMRRHSAKLLDMKKEDK